VSGARGQGPVPSTRCTWCGKRLRGEPVMLELDQRTNTYHADGVPAEFSQGWFPFGADCAKTVQAKRGAR
jgi:hypothetical protein